MLQIETVELSAEEQSQSVTTRPRIPPPDVTDRDKRTDHQTQQATKRTGRPAITTGTSGPVKHQLGKLNQQIAASTLRPGP